MPPCQDPLTGDDSRPAGRLSYWGGAAELMAGLPNRRAWVCVGPPLNARGPSRGSASFRSPGPVKLELLSLLRLWPDDTIVPLQFSALSAMIVFLSVMTAGSRLSIPIPAFPLMVTLVRFALLFSIFEIPSAKPGREALPLIVTLINVRVPSPSLSMPPILRVPVLPLTVELVINACPKERIAARAAVFPLIRVIGNGQGTTACMGKSASPISRVSADRTVCNCQGTDARPRSVGYPAPNIRRGSAINRIAGDADAI